MNADAVPDPESIIVTTAKDVLAKLVTMKSSVVTLASYVQTAATVDPKTVFAYNFLSTKGIAISVGSFGFNFFGGKSIIEIGNSFANLGQEVGWLENGIREWAKADSAGYGLMVQQYALSVNRRTRTMW